MSNDKIISVIVPVYGIEKIKKKFIKAIKSIQNQTYRNIEIILVNDGSKDNTLSVLNCLAEKDSRIKIINKTNGGVESSRREGLKNVTGDFVFHMDQDDLLKKNALELLFDAVEKDNSDVAVGESVRFFGIKTIARDDSFFEKSICLNHEAFMKDYFIGFFGVNNFPVNIWNKLYRKEFLDSVAVPPTVGLYNEDLNYNIHILPQAKKISILNETTYYYRWGGFTNHKIDCLTEVALSCYNLKKEMITEYNLDSREIPFSYYVSLELLNQINSVLRQEVEWNHLDYNEFKNRYNELNNIKEVRFSKQYLSDNEKALQHPHICFYLSDDSKALYYYILDGIRQNRRNKILSRFL